MCVQHTGRPAGDLALQPDETLEHERKGELDERLQSCRNGAGFENAIETRKVHAVNYEEEAKTPKRPDGTLDGMQPLVGIIMGSRSDRATMEFAAKTLEELGVPFEVKVISAHRTPDLLFEYASNAESRGIEVIIAGAGGAAHLPGMTAAKTTLPVLGVPVESKALKGLDSLLSIVQMPGGVPVATLAIGEAGAKNAALFAASVLANKHPEIKGRLKAFREKQTRAVLDDPDPTR